MGSFLKESWEGQEVRGAFCHLLVYDVSNFAFIFISQNFFLGGISPTNASALFEDRTHLPLSCCLFLNHIKALESQSHLCGLSGPVCQMMAAEGLVWGNSNLLYSSHTSTLCRLFLDTYFSMSLEIIASGVGGPEGKRMKGTRKLWNMRIYVMSNQGQIRIWVSNLLS